jgi:hypothetical protein
MRISLVPLEPGRSSCKFLIFEAVMVPASGRPRGGSRAAQHVDRAVGQAGADQEQDHLRVTSLDP